MGSHGLNSNLLLDADALGGSGGEVFGTVM